jgi:hypothetical protein
MRVSLPLLFVLLWLLTLSSFNLVCFARCYS